MKRQSLRSAAEAVAPPGASSAYAEAFLLQAGPSSAMVQPLELAAMPRRPAGNGRPAKMPEPQWLQHEMMGYSFLQSCLSSVCLSSVLPLCLASCLGLLPLFCLASGLSSVLPLFCPASCLGVLSSSCCLPGLLHDWPLGMCTWGHHWSGSLKLVVEAKGWGKPWTWK